MLNSWIKQLSHDRFVGRKHAQIRKFLCPDPSKFVVFDQAGFSTDDACMVHGEVEIGVWLHDADHLSDLGGDLKLFFQFSDQAFPGVFAGIDLSTRKLPVTSIGVILHPEAHENQTISFDHGGCRTNLASLPISVWIIHSK